ncbi:MAG: GFA family protein [Sphingomonas sp.]|nr:GFA family protein [Sphingomonas sp.]
MSHGAGCLCGAVRFTIESEPTCGTPLTSQAHNRPHLIFLRIGTLDDPNLMGPQMTIWTSQAPDWACISADIPSLEKQPPPVA